jgi:hypothetical protein
LNLLKRFLKAAVFVFHISQTIVALACLSFAGSQNDQKSCRYTRWL